MPLQLISKTAANAPVKCSGGVGDRVEIGGGGGGGGLAMTEMEEGMLGSEEGLCYTVIE